MKRLKITSSQNAQVKEARKLHNRRVRDESSLFLIEGLRELQRAFTGGVGIQRLFICPEFFLEDAKTFVSQLEANGTTIIECHASVFQKLVFRERTDGLIAIAVQMKESLATLGAKMSTLPFFVIAEGIEKPGNLGSILRSSDGAGADGVIVCDRCTDIYNPNVVRASLGTLFTQPVIEADGGEVFLWMQEHNVKIISTSPAAKIDYRDVDFTGSVAIVVGKEQIGLSEMWLKASDVQVSIPMKGVADSLNVGSATTLLLYEVLRQRKRGFPLENRLL